jgi:metal-sulfur cluster biosynthetic enzyme
VPQENEGRETMSDETTTWWREPVPEERRDPQGQPAGLPPDQAAPAEMQGPPPWADAADGPPPAEPVRPDEEPRTDPAAMQIRDEVVEALRNVHDPELGINIVDLGLVYGVDVYSDQVYITYTLTTIACPIGPLIEMEMQRFLADVPGIERVQAEMVFRPPWTPEMMSEEAKAALGFF